jgi:hypothetical protein
LPPEASEIAGLSARCERMLLQGRLTASALGKYDDVPAAHELALNEKSKNSAKDKKTKKAKQARGKSTKKDKKR